jgi:hypothetical protein
MKNKNARLVAIAAVVSMGLAGCTMVPTEQTVSVAPAYQTEGSVVPVYNPPPNTPFRCVGTTYDISVLAIPGDQSSAITVMKSPPAATTGNRRGDWLLVVTHQALLVGFMNQLKEVSSKCILAVGVMFIRMPKAGLCSTTAFRRCPFHPMRFISP